MSDNMLLRDQNIPPTADLLAEALGAANNAFLGLTDGLKRYGITLTEWRYYNDGKAWFSKGEFKRTTARGTDKVKPIFWLSVWEGFFKIAFYFGNDARDELLSLPISQDAKNIIETAKPMGKTMKFIPLVFDITGSAQLDDVYILAEFRKIRVK